MPNPLELAVLLLFAVALGIGWAQEAIPRPEHPRPDFQRKAWLNLNGTWQFEVDDEETGEERGLTSGTDLAGEIVVPFCPESSLSGVGRTEFMNRVWYRRHFEVGPELMGRRLLLHFGAVDWHAKVWLNGTLVGEHRGGYTPFVFDVTDLVHDGPNELVVSAADHLRSGFQARGKQSDQPASYGCVYTRTTGIWQTVWLEAVGNTYLREFALTPDVDGGRLLFQGWVAGPSAGAVVRLRASVEGRVVAEASVPASGRSTLAVLTIPDPVLWEPGRPFLYDLSIVIERDGAVEDEVSTYFGLRKTHTDGRQFLINDRRVFQRLVLDQGFYPDGIYTAPTDEALRRDIELSMAAGFNGARLHQKLFEPRFLYWADRLGYIVWGEYADWGLNHMDPAAVAQFVLEWREALRRDRNHPSIIGWCPLNETPHNEGNALLQALLGVTQQIDPTRPLLDTSGYVHLNPDTDVLDCHNYDQNPASLRAAFSMFALTGENPWRNDRSDPRGADRGQPYFVSEYGGTHLAREGQEGAWGYSTAGDLETFLARYRGLTDALLDNPYMFGFCYTQLTDIEQEQNGIYYYDRTPKYDVALIREINERPAAYETIGPGRPLSLTTLVPTSRASRQTWRYTTEQPPANWMSPDFDDSGWAEGIGGFGREGTPGAVIGTEWTTADIWLRRSFVYDGQPFDIAAFDIHHDEDATLYLNATPVTQLTGFTQSYTLAEATEQIRAALVEGTNVLAVHCHQEVGGQFIDVGVVLGSRR